MKTETTAKVSVIVPVHNTAKWLARCVESVRRQTLPDIEIILAENGSTDGSAELCDVYAREDGRIRVLHLAHADLSGARNAGLAVASAKYVGFVDSDDYLEPDMVARLLDAAERCDAEMAYCDFISEAEEAPQTVPDSEVAPQLLTPQETLRELLLEKLSPAVWTKLFDRRLFGERQFPDDYFFEDLSNHAIDDDKLARLMTFPNVLVTSHQAFFTREAMTNIAQVTLDNISDFFGPKLLPNAICARCDGSRNIIRNTN